MATRGLKLLFDENVSHRHIEFVAKESKLAEMQHLRTIGWSGKPDPEWIPLAVRQKFIIITADRNEQTRGYTVADFKAMQARVILLAAFWDHIGRWDKAKWLVRRIESIVSQASELKPGSVSMIDRHGQGRAI